MSLPIVTAPQYEIKLVSLKKPVKFRPYIMKEEKTLLMAKQSQDPTEIDSAVREMIRSCTFGSVDVGRLPSFDLEYLFLQLRAKSVNNVVEVFFECHNKPESCSTQDGKCHAQVPITIDLDAVKITVPDGHTNTVWLTDEVGIELRYPTAAIFEQYSLTEEAEIAELLVACLDKVFTKSGEVHELSERAPDEVREFVEQLTIPQVQKIREVFFDTMPHLEHMVHFKCPKCGYEEDIKLSGLMDFFD